MGNHCCLGGFPVVHVGHDAVVDFFLTILPYVSRLGMSFFCYIHQQATLSNVEV